MKISKLLSILLVLALMLCLLPSAALADPEQAEPSEEPSDAALTEEKEPAPAEEEEPAPAEEEEPAPAKEEEPAPAEDAPPAEEAEEAEPAPQPSAPEKRAEEPAPVINASDEVCYPMEGETVYNNGGTVYSNGALVYNNGGLVYQNSGTVYNNGGIVYANGGVVYNNGGTVYRHEALVYTFDDDVQQSHIYGSFQVSTAEDISAFAEIEGLDENGRLLEGESCTVRVREGFLLESVEADTGLLTENEDGSWTLTEPAGDVILTVLARPEAPVFDLEEGCYAEAQTLTITAPEGTEICYTLDGSTPDGENGLLYEEPIPITEGLVVIAAAFAPGAQPSDCTEAVYALVSITPPDLPAGEAEGSQPKAAAFTVENPGATDARIESVSLSGRDAESFVLSTEKGRTVRAGSTDEKTWSVRPAEDLKKGSYKATVLFTLEGGHTVEFEIRYQVR